MTKEKNSKKDKAPDRSRVVAHPVPDKLRDQFKHAVAWAAYRTGEKLTVAQAAIHGLELFVDECKKQGMTD